MSLFDKDIDQCRTPLMETMADVKKIICNVVPSMVVSYETVYDILSRLYDTAEQQNLTVLGIEKKPWKVARFEIMCIGWIHFLPVYAICTWYIGDEDGYQKHITYVDKDGIVNDPLKLEYDAINSDVSPGEIDFYNTVYQNVISKIKVKHRG